MTAHLPGAQLADLERRLQHLQDRACGAGRVAPAWWWFDRRPRAGHRPPVPAGILDLMRGVATAAGELDRALGR